MICHFSLVLLSLKLLLCNCFTSLIPEISLGVSSLEHLCSSSIVDHPNALFLLSIAKEQGGAIPFSIAQFMSGNDFARGLVSGAISRVSKEVLLHPFDTIRARQQVQIHIYFYNNLLPIRYYI